jgi:hypothetical protein
LSSEQNTEAQRLAEQRLGDISSARDRDLEDARALGRREALVEVERKETAEHFATINGSIGDTAKALEALTIEVRAITEEQGRRDSVNEALAKAAASAGAQKLSLWQKVMFIVMALLALGSLIIATIAVVTHS